MSAPVMKCSIQSRVVVSKVSCQAQLPSKPVCSSRPRIEAGRREIIGFFCGSLATLSLAQAPAALAYGGTKQLREMDAGRSDPSRIIFLCMYHCIKKRRKQLAQCLKNASAFCVQVLATQILRF